MGSTSYITNLDGEVVQHIEYVPFGEVFIEERNNKWNTPYLFNAKELDEETGLYYYGARYYDSRGALWLGVDPMQEKYYSWSPYAYCLNNPLRFTDPTGREVDLSGMSEEERKRYESQIATQRENSKLFNTMYSSLESSKDVYVIQYGKTISVNEAGDPVDGQFLPNEKGGRVVTFSDALTELKGGVVSEELFHAYQHDNRANYGNGEFNIEFEAKSAVTAIGNEYGGFGAFPGAGDFQDKITLGDYGNNTMMITPKNVVSSSFLKDYNGAANSYAKYNIDNKIGNSYYQAKSTVVPYSLQQMVKKAYGK